MSDSDSRQVGALDLTTEEFIERLEQALDASNRALKEGGNGFVGDVRGFVKLYLEGRAWLVCELDIGRGANEIAVLACLNLNATVSVRANPRNPPTSGDTRKVSGRNQKPVLVDVAEFVQSPEGVPVPVLVGLYLLDKDILDLNRAAPKAPVAPDLSGKAVEIISEREPGLFRVATEWFDEGYGDVIERATQIASGIPDYRVDFLVGLMERLKNNFNLSFPLIKFKSQSVEVCRHKVSDPNLYVRNVFLCAR